MTATIRAECATCGMVDLEPVHVVRVGTDAYRFECPRCLVMHTHEASTTVDRILEEVGCQVVPAGPITEAEIQAFVERMGT